MLTKEELPDCPVATTLQLIGNKWKMLILRNLLTRPWRFNEMQRSIPGISQKVLTDNLRALEADGIITRTVYPEVPPRVEYALSELGESMRPIINALETWGTGYQKVSCFSVYVPASTGGGDCCGNGTGMAGRNRKRHEGCLQCVQGYRPGNL